MYITPPVSINIDRKSNLSFEHLKSGKKLKKIKTILVLHICTCEPEYFGFLPDFGPISGHKQHLCHHKTPSTILREAEELNWRTETPSKEIGENNHRNYPPGVCFQLVHAKRHHNQKWRVNPCKNSKQKLNKFCFD